MARNFSDFWFTRTLTGRLFGYEVKIINSNGQPELLGYVTRIRARCWSGSFDGKEWGVVQGKTREEVAKKLEKAEARNKASDEAEEEGKPVSPSRMGFSAHIDLPCGSPALNVEVKRFSRGRVYLDIRLEPSIETLGHLTMTSSQARWFLNFVLGKRRMRTHVTADNTKAFDKLGQLIEGQWSGGGV